MAFKNFKRTHRRTIRLVIHAILAAGVMFSAILAQAVKASSGPLSGLERAQMGSVSLLAADVTISGNAGVGGATMNYTGGSTTADGSGNYIVTIPSGWTGTVTPIKTGYNFTPNQKDYTNVVANQVGQNYAATLTEYTLTITSAHGTVTRSPNQATYHYGDVVHLTHTDSAGYKFDHWSDSVTGATIYPPGAVAISLDDGKRSVYTDVYPYMKSKGIAGTYYIICGEVNKWSDSLTTAQLQDLDANGWSIANHTVDHTSFYALTEIQQEAEILGCKNFLDSIGLTKASSYVAYPNGEWNTDTLIAMTNTGMLTGRLATGDTFDPANVYRLEMPSGSETTLAAVKQETDYAISNHLIYFWHGHMDGRSGEMTLADFKAWIDYLALNHIPTMTINDVYERTFTPIDITILGNTAVTANYTRVYTISGKAGIGGVELNYPGGTTLANASGNYTLTVPSGWTGIVTPSKTGYRISYTFSPTNRQYTNVQTNLTGQNYNATANPFYLIYLPLIFR